MSLADLTHLSKVFVDPGAYADEERFHAACRVLWREQPVIRVESERYRSFWAVNRHADVLEIERDHEHFRNSPRPRHVLRELTLPTPAGVPVKVTSRVRSGSTAEGWATRRGTEKMRSLVRASRTVSPSTEQPSRRSSGSGSSSGETTNGPIGPYPRRDLPKENCIPAANWSRRSLMS